MIGSHAFNWLSVRGPLPYLEDREEYLLPTPRDIYIKEGKMETMVWKATSGPGHPGTDLVAFREGPPSKEAAPEWIGLKELDKYIQGEMLENWENPEIFLPEYKIGVALEEDRRAKEDQLFAVEHARFKENVSLKAEIRGWEKATEEEKNLLARMDGALLGGDGRTCSVDWEAEEFNITPPQASRNLVKWVLLSPAVYTEGTIPNFVCPNSLEIQMQHGVRGPGRKIQNARRISGRLQGWVTGKPEVISLFDGVECRAKAVYEAVPAGTVYLFETEEPEALIRALHNRCLSAVLGEKGLGWGICATLRKEERK